MILIGKVLEVLENSVIRFTIPHLVDDSIAYPIQAQEIVKEGEEIIIVKLDNHLNTNFLYKRTSSTSDYTLEANGVRIRFSNDTIYMEYGDGMNKVATEPAVLGNQFRKSMQDLTTILSTAVNMSGAPVFSPDTNIKLRSWITNLSKVMSDIVKLH